MQLSKSPTSAIYEMTFTFLQGLDVNFPNSSSYTYNILGGQLGNQTASLAPPANDLFPASVPFISLEELRTRLDGKANDIVVLDVREKDAYASGHIPGAKHLPRGQLELRINEELPDPTVRIVTCCEFGKISTLAAATLRELGFMRASALDGGMKAWRESDYLVGKD